MLDESKENLSISKRLVIQIMNLKRFMLKVS